VARFENAEIVNFLRDFPCFICGIGVGYTDQDDEARAGKRTDYLASDSD
jgi:hypothetical protein